jgi:pyruvate/2-oxoglutarate dehydrogenase complex dihydrolipoamide dehydrogenase (E3) component
MDDREMMPHDVFNAELIGNVRPPGWENPKPAEAYNLVIVGAGTAGLVAASGAAQLGAKVALIEKSFLGGDCLNLGCVPSKTIISSSRVSEEIREAAGHGVRVLCGAEADFPAVMERMRRLRAKISRHDSAERLKSLGVDVFLGEGRFLDGSSVAVGSQVLRFKKALIATGARALHPPVEGLAEAGYLTNENVFSLTKRPARLAVLGGGAIGCELAQAMARLGSQVTLFHNKARLLDREDPEASEIVERAFARDGIRMVMAGWVMSRVESSGSTKVLHLQNGEQEDHIVVDEVLVAVGRVPNVDNMGLEMAGVDYDRRAGVKVDEYLRTTNPDIYAAGDVCLKFKFTHMADAAARAVIRNALFRGRKKLGAAVIPWCTFTDPEVAHAGMYEEDAARAGIEFESFVRNFADVDRSILEGEEEGFVKILVKKGTDRIIGATVVSPFAGEHISELAVAMEGGVGLSKLSEIIHPYPTRSEAIKQVADLYNRTRLTPTVKRLLSRWLAYQRK